LPGNIDIFADQVGKSLFETVTGEKRHGDIIEKEIDHEKTGNREQNEIIEKPSPAADRGETVEKKLMRLMSTRYRGCHNIFNILRPLKCHFSFLVSRTFFNRAANAPERSPLLG